MTTPDDQAAEAPRAAEAGEGRLTRRAADSRREGAGAFSLARAFRCAGQGVAYAFMSQRNLKIQWVIGAVAVIAGFVLSISQADWLAVVLCITMVSVAEVVNTAIESVVDIASPGWHELARAAKDAAAGAVLLASIGSVVVGIIVFLPKLLELIA